MKTNSFGKINFPVNSPQRFSQRGVGMIEVLVAMLLLAIGVLGYAALQVRAVEATSEALNRSQSMVILRGLAEKIRVNNAAQLDTPAIPANPPTVPLLIPAVNGYPSAIRTYSSFSSSTTAPTPNCNAATCNVTQMAAFDAYQSAKAAFDLGVKVSMADCPSVSSAPVKRQCLYAAWDKTTLANVNPLLATPGATDCMSASGVYQPQATCVMLEAY